MIEEAAHPAEPRPALAALVLARAHPVLDQDRPGSRGVVARPHARCPHDLPPGVALGPVDVLRSGIEASSRPQGGLGEGPPADARPRLQHHDAVAAPADRRRRGEAGGPAPITTTSTSAAARALAEAASTAAPARRERRDSVIPVLRIGSSSSLNSAVVVRRQGGRGEISPARAAALPCRSPRRYEPRHADPPRPSRRRPRHLVDPRAGDPRRRDLHPRPGHDRGRGPGLLDGAGQGDLRRRGGGRGRRHLLHAAEPGGGAAATSAIAGT